LSLPLVLAIDIGGTKMACAVVDAAGELLASVRIETPASGDGEVLFEALVQACRALGLKYPMASLKAVGVGCGGPMRYPSGVVSPVNIAAWREFPLRDRLINVFELPTVVDNDAKALAVGERWRGAGQNSDNMLGMVVSTGVGGGIILDGQLLHGEAGNAGHIGHIIVWPNGPLCGCGAFGCVEGIASGSGLARRLSVAVAEGQPTSLRSGASAADIAVAARAGDQLARELFRTAGEAVGRGIASAAALLDLERVVIGGSIALQAWDLLGPPLESELQVSARLDFTRNVHVANAKLGDRAGLFGAAQLALTLL
jgi:glucokinase